jgi:hypothetical protein
VIDSRQHLWLSADELRLVAGRDARRNPSASQRLPAAGSGGRTLPMRFCPTSALRRVTRWTTAPSESWRCARLVSGRRTSAFTVATTRRRRLSPLLWCMSRRVVRRRRRLLTAAGCEPKQAVRRWRVACASPREAALLLPQRELRAASIPHHRGSRCSVSRARRDDGSSSDSRVSDARIRRSAAVALPGSSTERLLP